MAEKWILAPPGKWEKNGQKNGKIGQNWQFSHFSAIFLPFFPVGPKSIFRPFFSHFGPGNQDRNARSVCRRFWDPREVAQIFGEQSVPHTLKKDLNFTFS